MHRWTLEYYLRRGSVDLSTGEMPGRYIVRARARTRCLSRSRQTLVKRTDAPKKKQPRKNAKTEGTDDEDSTGDVKTSSSGRPRAAKRSKQGNTASASQPTLTTWPLQDPRMSRTRVLCTSSQRTRTMCYTRSSTSSSLSPARARRQRTTPPERPQSKAS